VRSLINGTLLLVMCCPPVLAQDQTVGARIGGLGVGIEYSYRLSDRIALRGGLNGWGLDFTDFEAGIEYDFSLDLDSFSVGVDVHPMKGPFRVSIGILRNDNALHAIRTPTTPLAIGSSVYQPSDIGSLIGSVRFDKAAPLVSVGWDFRYEKKLGVTLEFGVVDQGPPIIALGATGLISSDPQFIQDVERERIELEDAFAGFDFYPFAMLGMAFRF